MYTDDENDDDDNDKDDNDDDDDYDDDDNEVDDEDDAYGNFVWETGPYWRQFCEYMDAWSNLVKMERLLWVEYFVNSSEGWKEQ